MIGCLDVACAGSFCSLGSVHELVDESRKPGYGETRPKPRLCLVSLKKYYSSLLFTIHQFSAIHVLSQNTLPNASYNVFFSLNIVFFIQSKHPLFFRYLVGES